MCSFQNKPCDSELHGFFSTICDTGIVPVIAVSSSQTPNGPGDGDISTDWQVIDPNNVLLRAERAGADLGGRIYTIMLTASDSAGGKGSGAVTVLVPHDQGNWSGEKRYPDPHYLQFRTVQLTRSNFAVQKNCALRP